MADVVVFRPDEAWDGLKKLEADPVVDVEPIERRSAYRFHRDVFSSRLAYVRHPHYPRFLIQFSEFDEFVLQDKFNETLRVLTALGASQIRCSSHRQRTRRFGAGFGVGGGKFEAKREHARNSRFDYEYAGAGGAPVDPRPLRWPGEPGIEAAIEGVLRNGATSVRITVNRDDSVSLDTDVPLRLKKFGVELGLHTARGQVDTLEFEATFPVRGKAARAR
jgi:hypothetical protein